MLRHCSRRLRFSLGNDMAREVYAKLDRSLEIQRDDVLRIRVASQLLGS